MRRVLPVLMAFALAGCPSASGDTETTETTAEARPKRKKKRKKRRPRKRRPGRTEPAKVPAGEVQEVALRFHLLKAPGSRWLDTTVDEAKVRAWVAEVNEVWAAASIRFSVERVLLEKAIDPAAHDAATDRFLRLKREAKKAGKAVRKKDRSAWSPELKAAKRDSSEARQRALPKHDRIDRGIDIYVVGQLPAAGGVFGCPLGAVIYAEKRKSEADGLNIAKVLAHELGHALSLKHTRCGDDANLMMEAGCKHRRPENESLNAAQIEAARAVAATGRARVCKGGETVED